MNEDLLTSLLQPGFADRLRQDPCGFASVVEPAAGGAAGRFEGAYGAMYARVIREPLLRRFAARALWGAGTPLEHLEELVGRAVARLPHGGLLLDVPCGSGSLLPLLDAAGFRGQVVCADLSGEMLDRAARAPRLRRRFDVAFLQCDAMRLPLRDACFDAVVSINGLHCLPDQDAFLRELRRVLADGADAWIVTMLQPAGPRHRVVAEAARRAGVIPRMPPSAHELRVSALRAGFAEVEHLGGRGLAAFRLG